jgi:hypothetical protein
MIFEWLEEVRAMMDVVSFALASFTFAGLCVWIGWFACSHVVNACRLAFGEDDDEIAEE